MKRLFLTTIVVGVMAVIMSGCEKEETFTVQFDSKGGSFVAIQTVKKGGKVTEPKEPTRDNYDFVGWATADNSTSSLWDFNNGTVEADIVLYARWKTKGGGGGGDDEYFTVKLDSKGGSYVQEKIVKKGEKVSRPSDPTRDNYDFVGWSTADNSTSSLWNFSNGTVEADMTLYARWTAKGGGGGDGTPLGAEDAFEIKHVMSDHPNNEDPPEDVGIRWESIIYGTFHKARFVPVPSTERFVELTKKEFDAIKTKEALKKAHEDGSKSPSFEWTKLDFEDSPKYFITKNGTTYSLVQMTSLTFGMGVAYAVIKYRQ